MLKYKIILKNVPSGGTRVDSKWVKELQQEKAIGLCSMKKILANETA